MERKRKRALIVVFWYGNMCMFSSLISDDGCNPMMNFNFDV
jgi:hypothetical protein